MTTLPRPLRVAGYRLEPMDDELLLFNPESVQVMYLNSSASIIWQLCDGQRSAPDIVQLLSDAYPESASEIEQDVTEALQRFKDCGAVEFV